MPEWRLYNIDHFPHHMSRYERGELLDLGCVAAHGHFNFDAKTQSYRFTPEGKPATAFLPNLISQLQFSGTAPMIDVQAYAQWLAK